MLKAKCQCLVSALLIVIFLSGCAATPITPPITPPTAKPEAVLIADRNLGAALLNALGKPPGEPMSVEELAGLTELTANYANITNLSGIEHCPNLIKLDLAENSEDMANIRLLEEKGVQVHY